MCYSLIYSVADGYQTVDKDGTVVLGKHHGSQAFGWNNFQLSSFFQVEFEGTRSECIRVHKARIQREAECRGMRRPSRELVFRSCR